MSPIATIRPRYREVGRLRLGEVVTGPGGRSRPQALGTWRLTSAHLEPIRAAQALWGGRIVEHDGLLDLTTEASALPVLVPEQDPLATQWLEEWSAGGLVRRCDGLTQVSGEPCLRGAEEGLEELEGPGPCGCQPTTHLLVVLPDLPDLGVWRLTTRGWAAASELPRAVEMVLTLAGRGRLPRAELAIERRSRRSGGQTHQFVVPVLRVPYSLAELAEPARPLELPGGVDPQTGEILPGPSAAPAGPGPSPAAADHGHLLDERAHAAAGDPSSSEGRQDPEGSPSEDLMPGPGAEENGEASEVPGSGSTRCLHLEGTRTVTGARGQRVEVCVRCGRPLEVQVS